MTVSRTDGSSTSVGSDYAFLGPYDFVSPVAGHDKIREWGVAQTDDQGISIARVLVSWDEGDSTDYLAGGYWMHLAGDVDTLAFDGIEIGAFVDGPELSLSSPPDMPVQGGASYFGPTGGIYTASHAGDTGWAPGSLEIGEFDSTIHLDVDFAAGEIDGCVGCITPIALSSVLEDGATGDLYELETADSGYRLFLFPATFASDGIFRGQHLSLGNHDPDSPIVITDTEGAWGGQFSNILAAVATLVWWPVRSVPPPKPLAGARGCFSARSSAPKEMTTSVSDIGERYGGGPAAAVLLAS